MIGTRSKSKENQAKLDSTPQTVSTKAMGDSNNNEGERQAAKKDICNGSKGSRCGKPVQEGEQGIQCDLCMSWYHSQCQDVMGKAYETLQRSNLAWLCDLCKDKLPFLRKCLLVGDSILESNASLERIEKKIDDLKTEVGKHERIEKKIDSLKTEVGKQERIEKKIDDMKADDTSRNTNIPQVIQECMKKVEENKKDEDKRKCNVVVTNLDESQADQSSERMEEDAKNFTELVKNVLKMNVKVKKAFRAGAKREAKPRPLIITLESEAVKWDVLKQGKALREEEDEQLRKVYINPDLPKEERERLWKVREECRTRKAKGENVKVIKGKCVTVGEH